MEKQQQKQLSKTEEVKKTNKFVRVAIEEESDEEEVEEPKIEEVQKGSSSDKENEQKGSNKQKIEVVESKENKTWWKPSDVSYEDFAIKTKDQMKIEEVHSEP